MPVLMYYGGVGAAAIFTVLLLVRLIAHVDPWPGDHGRGLEIGGKQIKFICPSCNATSVDAEWRYRRSIWYTLRPMSERLGWRCPWCATSHVEPWPTFHAKPPAPVVTPSVPAPKPEPSRNPEERFAAKED